MTGTTYLTNRFPGYRRREPQRTLLRAVVALASTAMSLGALAVDLNTANRAELEQLNGFGVATAARVLDERSKAPFKDWTDFAARIKGIRAQRLEQLRRQGVTINGTTPPAAASK